MPNPEPDTPPDTNVERRNPKLTITEKHEARQALHRLKGSGLSLAMAVEMALGMIGRTPRTPDEYHYSCALLILETLAHGLLHHSVRWDEDPVTHNRSGRTLVGGNRATVGLDPELFQRYNTLHPAVKHLCVRAFVDGHRRPNVRPTLADWQWTLREQVCALKAS